MALLLIALARHVLARQKICQKIDDMAWISRWYICCTMFLTTPHCLNDGSLLLKITELMWQASHFLQKIGVEEKKMYVTLV